MHLRRFKYDEARRSIIKLTWLIPFPYKIAIKTNYSAPKEPSEEPA